MSNKLEFPKKNQRFTLPNFFQEDVDEFNDGKFMFLSAKEIYIKTNKFLKDKTEYINNKGFVISTYCYTTKYYYKILVSKYQQIPWVNHYKIESTLSNVNSCDGYAVNETIEEFLTWFKY